MKSKINSTSDQVARQLEFLKEDKVRIELGKKARQWIIKYHSPVVFSDRIKSLYGSILNG